MNAELPEYLENARPDELMRWLHFKIATNFDFSYSCSISDLKVISIVVPKPILDSILKFPPHRLMSWIPSARLIPDPPSSLPNEKSHKRKP